MEAVSKEVKVTRDTPLRVGLRESQGLSLEKHPVTRREEQSVQADAIRSGCLPTGTKTLILSAPGRASTTARHLHSVRILPHK